MGTMKGWDPDRQTYRGVPAPEYVRRQMAAGQLEPAAVGWCEGAVSAITSGTLPGSLSLDVSAFLAVTEDRTQDARRTVKNMSGRDRAVLSFWLQELSRIVEDAELSRRI